jgi:hypothetical protein
MSIPKYQKYLYLTLDENDVDYDKYDYDHTNDNFCIFCGCKCKRTYITYIHKKQIKTMGCYLCHIVTNFKKYHIGKVILIKSKLNQYDINKTIMEHYYNHGTVLTLEEIDKDAKMIPVQTFEFANLISNSKVNSMFKNFVIFFTEEITKTLNPKQKSMFVRTDNDPTFPLFNYPKYRLSSDETETLNNLRKESKKLEQKYSKMIMRNIKNKITDAKKSVQMLEQLCQSDIF